MGLEQKKLKIETDDGYDFYFTPEQYKKVFINEEIGEAMQIENYKECDDDGNPIETNEDWKSVVLDISKYPSKEFSDLPEIPFGDVSKFVEMKDGNEGYLSSYSELSYYAYKYQQFVGFHPHIYRLEQFNVNKFIMMLFKNVNVPLEAYIKSSYQGSNPPSISSMAILFSNNIFMYVDGEDKATIYYDPKDERDENSLFYSLIGILKTFKRPKVSENKIYIVYRASHGFDKKGFDIKKINVDLQENYNEGFVEMSEEIITGLNRKNKTNLVILSGEPGTGKCVVGDTKITIRNKKTGKIEEINIADLM